MAVSDPLIKELKVLLLQLIGEGATIVTDECDKLIHICVVLEHMFKKGLKAQIVSVFKNLPPEPWDWLNAVGHGMQNGRVEKSFKYMRCWEEVNKCVKVMTLTGKFRLLIRYCLVNKCLHVPVTALRRSQEHGGKRWYYPEDSIIGNNILCEILLATLRQCSDNLFEFKLKLNNSRFLDKSWVIPQHILVECVPCSSLGISLCFVDDTALVAVVDPTGVAAEDGKIEVGDVLDELNGIVITKDVRGKLGRTLRAAKRGPIQAHIIKPYIGADLYPPLNLLIRKAGLNITRREDSSEHIKQLGHGGQLYYMGSAKLGDKGHVKLVEKGLGEVLTRKDTLPCQVRLMCEELGLQVTDETHKVLLRHSYMELSSCGQSLKFPKHFAYIVGNKNCNIATEFTCHVFQSTSDDECQSILQSIGQGFERTHFAV